MEYILSRTEKALGSTLNRLLRDATKLLEARRDRNGLQPFESTRNPYPVNTQTTILFLLLRFGFFGECGRPRL